MGDPEAPYVSALRRNDGIDYIEMCMSRLVGFRVEGLGYLGLRV